MAGSGGRSIEMFFFPFLSVTLCLRGGFYFELMQRFSASIKQLQMIAALALKLSSLKLGRPLFQKRLRPLILIFGRANHPEQHRLQIQTFA